MLAQTALKYDVEVKQDRRVENEATLERIRQTLRDLTAKS